MTPNGSKLPTGRPPGARSIRVLAARLSQDAMRVLAGVAANEESADADRVRAAEVILSYATSRSTAREAGDSHAA